MESKGLRVNVAKMKVMISGCSVGKPKKKEKFPCPVDDDDDDDEFEAIICQMYLKRVQQEEKRDPLVG